MNSPEDDMLMHDEALQSLTAWRQRYAAWLFQEALPLWATKGTDWHKGGFQEVIGMDGNIPKAVRRARVQGRQSFVFALAGKLSWQGQWALAAEHGLAYLAKCYRNNDGLYRTQVLADGTASDHAVMTYDQAFVLLATAQLYDVQRNRDDLKALARSLMRRIWSERRFALGGFWELGEISHLSNPQMHLLEAALFWAPLDKDPIWMDTATELVSLAFSRLIDPSCEALVEYFGPNWVISQARETLSIEPGHQFEWAWLLQKWAVLTKSRDAHLAARTLFRAGSRGIDAARNVAVDEVDYLFQPRKASARLWPQTERLKAAAILYESAQGAAASQYETEIICAARSLWRYLEVPLQGLWRDKMLPGGGFVEEPAPASSLYHIVMAVDALDSACRKGGPAA